MPVVVANPRPRTGGGMFILGYGDDPPGGGGSTPATEADVSRVSDSAINQTLLEQDTARLGFRIYNDSSAVLYVKYGATAADDDFTVALFSDDWLSEDNYSGRVDGVWSANTASGGAEVTSLT